MAHFVVAIVTKNTRILFFTLIFQWLKCSYLLSVVGVPFNVVLNKGEDHKEYFDTKIDQIACFSGKWEPKTWKMSVQICQKIIKMSAILEFLAAILEFWRYFGDLFYLKMLLQVITLFQSAKYQ